MSTHSHTLVSKAIECSNLLQLLVKLKVIIYNLAHLMGISPYPTRQAPFEPFKVPFNEQICVLKLPLLITRRFFLITRKLLSQEDFFYSVCFIALKKKIHIYPILLIMRDKDIQIVNYISKRIPDLA